tara:strand:+ start:3197 stop:4441 length:1245 start_codon:yes stop_codon:yes gene_type:complete
MATFKTISDGNIQSTRNVLNQLVDFVAEDMSGSLTTNNTRKKYQVFVTGGFGGTGVTSSLFQTVYDQNFALQTSNELFDLTVGLFDSSGIVTGSTSGTDTNGKRLFGKETLMMREKVGIYQQFAQLLLGNANSAFTAPFTTAGSTFPNQIDAALFVPYKRLFTRDGVKRETYAMRFFRSASWGANTQMLPANQTNLNDANVSGSVIFTDVGSGASIETSPAGGSVGNIVNSANTAETVGLLFYDYGVAVYDLEKIVSSSQLMSGAIDAVGTGARGTTAAVIANGKAALLGNFSPDFLVSASIDNIVDHIASTRFGSGSETFMTFQNNTMINSTLYFCRATADEFNFSSNPTFTDAEGRLTVIDTGQENLQKTFSFVTTVGLYNANEELLAVAKLSRPVMKNDEKDLTFRVRLDF